MKAPDYLVTFGQAGDFSRFRPVPPAEYSRGDRVVVRCRDSIRLGQVMCSALAEHDRFISPQPMGDLLRRATGSDEAAANRMRGIGEDIFADARRWTSELDLTIEIVDVDVTLDGAQATLSYVRSAECDYRPLVSNLSRRYDVIILMENLSLPTEEAGCGRPDCGHGEGGCSSCSSGGCSTGSCASGAKKEDIAAYLARLAAPTAMTPRTPLL